MKKQVCFVVTSIMLLCSLLLPFERKGFFAGVSKKGEEIESAAKLLSHYLEMEKSLHFGLNAENSANASIEAELFNYKTSTYGGGYSSFELKASGYLTENRTLLDFSSSLSGERGRDSYFCGQTLFDGEETFLRTEEWSDFKRGKASFFPERYLGRWIRVGEGTEGFLPAFLDFDMEAQKSFLSIPTALSGEFEQKRKKLVLSEKDYLRFCGELLKGDGFDSEAVADFSDLIKGEFTVDLSKEGEAEINFRLNINNKEQVFRIVKEGTIRIKGINSTYLKLPLFSALDSFVLRGES